MFSNLLKKTSGFFWVLLLVATLIPMQSLAAEPTDMGKITVDVRDENGVKMIGDWYLHQGTTDQGLVLRNGTKGEEFNFTAGVYFIEVRNLKLYPFYKVFSGNPQTLKIGGAITYTVQYFKTEAQKAKATSAPISVEPVVAPVSVPTIETPPVAPSAPAVVTPKRTPVRLNIVRPVVADPWIEEVQPAVNQEYSLAVTGPEGLLGALSLFSIVSGLWIVKRKNA